MVAIDNNLDRRAARRTGRLHGRAVDKKKSFYRARLAWSKLHRVGSARRVDKRETTAQNRVADLGRFF